MTTHPQQPVLTKPDSGNVFVHSASTVTASGSTVVSGVGSKELTLVVNVTATPTGTTPTLTYTLQEVDPGDLTAVFGPTVSTAAINAIGVYTISLGATTGGSVKVSWTITGAGASFTGVYATASTKVGTASNASGAITVTGTVTATNASTGTNNAAIPTSSTQVGGSDGTNLQAARVFDADTGGGTQYVLGVGLRKAASGGSVEAGTSSDPLRTDPTGTTAQPVTDNGGSLTVDGTVTSNIGTTNGLALDATLTGNNQRTRLTDGTNLAAVKAASTAAVAGDPALVVAVSPNNTVAVTDNGGSLTVDSAQLPAALVGARLDVNNGAWLGSTAPSVGSKTSANSIPVVVASDQGTIPVSIAASTVADTSVSGTLGALNDAVSISTVGKQSVGYRIATNNLAATVVVETSIDGTNYNFNGFFYDGSMVAPTVTSSLVFSGGVIIMYGQIKIAPGTSLLRVRVSAYTSGTSSGTLRASDHLGITEVNVTNWLGSAAPTVGSKTSANSIPVVVASDQGVVPVSDGGGSLTVDGTVTATVASTGATASAVPASATYAGFSDGTNLRGARVFDTDTGGGTEYTQGVVLRKSASGGSVELGTSSDPVRVDPTGTTTQPVSGTVTANIGTSGSLALDATLTGGTQKAIIRGGAKGSTTAADVTSTATGSNHQALDVAIVDASGAQITSFGGGTQFADGAARGSATGTLMMVDDGTLIQSASGDSSGRLNTLSRVTDGTNTAAVKAASTAAVASDPALVVAISPNNPISVSGTADATATGALGALNAAVQVTTAGLASVGFQLAAGTLVGTIIPEASFDGGTTWNATFFTDPVTGIKSSSVVFGVANTATARTIVGVGGSGLTRVRVSAYTSGTANITVRASLMEGNETLERFSSSGTGYTTLTSPLALPQGMIGQVTSYGTLKVTTEGSELFVEPFDGVTVDTTNRWTQTLVTGGTMTQASGSLTMATSTVASRAAALTSQNSFRAIGLGFQIFGASLGLEAVALTNNHRFWGLGTQPVSWAATTPIQDGVGFEQDTTGALNAVTYNAGTRTIAAVLTRPTDGLNHRYAMYIRADLVFWYLDTLEVPVASASWPPLGQQTLPIRLHSINHTTPPGSAPTFTVMGVGMTETSHSGVQISDGNFAWRKATVKPASTAPAITDTALVVTESPASGLAKSNVIQTNATVTAGGNTTVLGKPGNYVDLVINVTATPTGTNPTLQYSISEMDPQTGSTIVGSTVFSYRITASGTYRVPFRSEVSTTLKVSWTIGGTSSPTFTGVYVALIEKDSTAPWFARHPFGYQSTTNQTLLAIDDMSNTSTFNRWMWSSASSGMVADGVQGTLQINVTSPTTISSVYGGVVSNTNFPAYVDSPLEAIFVARASTASTNSTVAFGFGNVSSSFPLTVFGCVAGFIITGATPTVYAGNAIVQSDALLTLDPAVYYTFRILIDKMYFRVSVENSASQVLAEFRWESNVGNMPAFTGRATTFAHVFNVSAVGAAPSFRCLQHAVYALEAQTNKSYGAQLAGAGRSSYIHPVTQNQTLQLAANAAPSTILPNSTGSTAYATLGGEYVCTTSAASENLLGVFAFTVPAGEHTLHITDITITQPTVATALAASTGGYIYQWSVMVNASSGNPSSATGYRVPLGTFTFPTSAAVGTVAGGSPLFYNFGTPLVVQAGKILLVMYKIVTATGATGAIRGNVLINGYYE